MQKKVVSHRLAAVTWVSDKREDVLGTDLLSFGVLLLGLAIALVTIGAFFPEIFLGGFNHFGPGTP